MNALIIDCSYGMAIYLITEKGEYEFVDRDQKKHTDELLLTVHNLLQKAKLTANDITNLCVCVGPGSFTGIRVAVSICKGLAVTGDVKICTASNFDVIMQQGNPDAFYVLDGFSDNVYERKVQNQQFQDSCKKLEDLAEEIKQNPGFAVYCGSEKVQNWLKSHEISSKIAQNNTVLYFKDKIAGEQFTKISEISPIYLRASQAEIEREKRLKNGNK